MSRIKYGIDLGTTNSAIAEINKGKSEIRKNLNGGDTTPSCVGFRKNVVVGVKAANSLRADKSRALKSGKQGAENFFVEFKRTMGTDSKYFSENMNKNYSSEELSSEVLKTLKAQVQENFKSVVITIPAMFTDPQKSATIEAAKLAGFPQVELLQEPIAAASAFGVDEEVKDGKILVFDFGGGTFDVCLISIEDGIMQVEDTGGDNWLGGKNLDEAVIDKILTPWIQENYKIDSYLNDEVKKSLLNNVLKYYAEPAKIELSFSDESEVTSDLGEFPDDDEGNEIELDFVINKDQMKSALEPIFQKAIDITIDLLKRNKLKGNDLESLLLVGGPTFSPVLRDMIKKQICAPNTKVDPMTVVARGAAIYASKFDIDEEIKDEVRDETKIQLDLSYESQSVEEVEMLAIKINKEKTKGDVSSKILITIRRSDGGWDSDKTEVDETGEIIELNLEKSKSNNFEIIIADEKGDPLECEPSEFTIMQGVKTGSATIAYNYGIEIDLDGRPVFETITGLQKNQKIPAVGEMTGLKTQTEIRPGTKDHFKIPIYMGDDGANGTRASSHTHVFTATIAGKELPKLLPVNSEINLMLEIVSDSERKLNVDIPYLNETIDIEIPTNEQKGETDKWFDEQFSAILNEINTIKISDQNYDIEKLNKIEKEIENIKSNFENRKKDEDTRRMTRDNIRKQFIELDKLINESSWPSAKKEMEEMYYKIEEEVGKLKDGDKQKTQLDRFKSQMSIVNENEDVQASKELKNQMGYYYGDLLEAQHGVEIYIAVLVNFRDDFNSQPWTDKSKARAILDEALKVAVSNPSKDQIKNYCIQLWQLLPKAGKSGRKDILGR